MFATSLYDSTEHKYHWWWWMDGGMQVALYWKGNTLCLCNCFISLGIDKVQRNVNIDDSQICSLGLSPIHFSNYINLFSLPQLSHVHSLYRASWQGIQPLNFTTFIYCSIFSKTKHLNTLKWLENIRLKLGSQYFCKTYDKEFRSFILSIILSNVMVILFIIICLIWVLKSFPNLMFSS